MISKFITLVEATSRLTETARLLRSTTDGRPDYLYDFAKLELRVAKVLEVRPHPNADRLLLLQVDVGDQQKQIVAGIRHHYEPEQLVGKLIVIVNNLEPAMLRGEASNGMLLAATSGEKVVVLTVDDPNCVVGAKIK